MQENCDQSQLHIPTEEVAISGGNNGPGSFVCRPHKTHILLVIHYSEHELTRQKRPTEFARSGSWHSIAKSAVHHRLAGQIDQHVVMSPLSVGSLKSLKLLFPR